MKTSVTNDKLIYPHVGYRAYVAYVAYWLLVRSCAGENESHCSGISH